MEFVNDMSTEAWMMVGMVVVGCVVLLRRNKKTAVEGSYFLDERGQVYIVTKGNNTGADLSVEAGLNPSPAAKPGVNLWARRSDAVGDWDVRTGASIRPSIPTSMDGVGPDIITAAPVDAYLEAKGRTPCNGWGLTGRADARIADAGLEDMDVALTAVRDDLTVSAHGSVANGDARFSHVRASQEFDAADGRMRVDSEYDLDSERLDASVGYERGDTRTTYHMTNPDKKWSVRQRMQDGAVSAELNQTSDGGLAINSVEAERTVGEDMNAVASWRPGQIGAHVVKDHASGWVSKVGAIKDGNGINPTLSMSRRGRRD